MATDAPPPSAEVIATDAEHTSKDTTGELRTFLFADVRGYTRFTQERGDEAAARLVDKFATVTRDIVRSRGGELLELRGDEAMSVFSSARQALRAAVDLQARFARESELDPTLPLSAGIGIDAGEAVPFEGGYRGQALNLAARLCNLAGPGEILASEGVVYLGRRLQGVAYADRALIPVKGFDDPVRVIRVVPAPAASPSEGEAGFQSPLSDRAEPALPIGGFLGALPAGQLVARDDEWSQIMASLEAVMGGTGRLVLLAGEPGIGKTRLAQEVTLKARHWGFIVVTGRCYTEEHSTPYFPFLDVLTALYDASHPTVRAEIPRRWPQIGRLLPDQVGVVAVATGMEREDQHLLFRAVTAWIEAITESTPVALLIDDLHWADDSSIKLLQHLARNTRAHRVLLLGTYRDVEVNRQHPLESALTDMNREQLVQEVVVRRLDEDGTAALVEEILGEHEEPVDLGELIFRRTDGNAFFIGEMVRALVERGDLYRRDGRWERRAIVEMEVPKSVRSLIGQRLSRLDEQAQEILREASVLGMEFAFDDLVALGSLTFAPLPGLDGRERRGWMEDEIEAAMEGALIAGLVRETDSESYAFNHALTQQTLYAELSTRRRKRLHLATGQALERLPERVREKRAAELSWHYLEGDDIEQALRYALLAGDRAAGVFANGEAERHYGTALELSRELDDRGREVKALEKLAAILTIAARYDAALDLLESAAVLLRDANDREGEARAVAQMADVHYMRDTAEEGIERLETVLSTLEAVGAGPSLGLTALWAALARLYIDTQQYDKQLAAAERAIELGATLDPSSQLRQLVLSAEVSRGDALWGLGQDEDAIQVVEALIPRAERAGDLDNLARALSHAALYYSKRGQYDKDREYQARVLEVAERRGDRGQIVLGAMALSANAFLMGDWTQSRTYLERAEAVVNALDNATLATWPVAARGWLALREGDFETARIHAQELVVLTERATAPWRRSARRLVAELDMEEKRPAAALGELEPMLEGKGWKRDAPFLWTLARVHLELGNVDEAQDLAIRAVERSRSTRTQPNLVEALTVEGEILAHQGSWHDAASAFTEAVAMARELPFPLGEERALYCWGTMLKLTGEINPARRRLRKALEIAEKLGAKPDAERIRTALTTLRPPTR